MSFFMEGTGARHTAATTSGYHTAPRPNTAVTAAGVHTVTRRPQRLGGHGGRVHTADTERHGDHGGKRRKKDPQNAQRTQKRNPATDYTDSHRLRLTGNPLRTPNAELQTPNFFFPAVAFRVRRVNLFSVAVPAKPAVPAV
jgi:hypothetical protein